MVCGVLDKVATRLTVLSRASVSLVSVVVVLAMYLVKVSLVVVAAFWLSAASFSASSAAFFAAFSSTDFFEGLRAGS